MMRALFLSLVAATFCQAAQTTEMVRCDSNSQATTTGLPAADLFRCFDATTSIGDCHFRSIVWNRRY